MNPDRPPLVVMTCGVAGSGKSTLARSLEPEGFVPLSVDQEVWIRASRHGVDYPPERYAGLSEIAEAAVRERLVALVRGGCDVVLDLSLWRRADRDAYEALAERAGRRDADAAFAVTDELLATCLASFETSDGEGEEVLTPDGVATWWPR